jgi:cytochrome c peroxidase
VTLLITCCVLCAFTGSDKLFRIPQGWNIPEYDFSKNPLTPEKVELGRVLFYDPILSQNNTISCASCHSQYSAFTHTDHALSHGIDEKMGTRNAPALMNLAWQNTFMWDGAVNHLDVQALAPIHNPVEMNETMRNVVTKLQRSNVYPALYQLAFGDSTITGEHTLKAIAQFMLTLVSANSKYDKVQRKEEEFTEQERKGYGLFKDHCVSCHTEPLFTTNTFANNGLSVDTTLNDVGRMSITHNPTDSLLFKIPTLRNIEFSYPYMHDGRFKTLTQVLNHYASGIRQSLTLSKEVQKPIMLSSNEKVDITAFLLTLTDKEFLFNPKLSYPSAILKQVNSR